MNKRNVFRVLFVLLAFVAQVAWAQAPVDSPAQAITGLLNRIGGNGAADKFEIVIDANLAENGKDVFVIAPGDGKPCIKGNTQLSVATGINWYLNHYAHINLTWNNLTTDLSQVTLPVPASEEKHVCNTTYRYDFNTCTFSYSMAFWTWERWQQEIDWMALHGINAPLNLVGLDVVTRKFLKELGVSDSDINAYIAGPGFIAWFAMNNLEGWGGTINSSSTGVQMNGNPDWWYTRQEQLCRNMLQRMRELGMQPVIPGFSGQVPNCITNYTIDGFSAGDVVNNGTWAGGYTRPDILKPNSTSYATFAPIYYKHLHDVMGVSELYSMDPFHEGSLPSGVSNETCYPNIMAKLDAYHDAVDATVKSNYKVNSKAKWMIQYWQGVPQSGAFSAMSSYGDRFIGLDLFADNIYADNAAKWRTNYYNGRPYIYCMLHNFGGRSGLHGRLETTMDGYFQALAKGNNCQGIGATPEGTETNPILYDMLFELPWMDVNNRPTADKWLEDYAYSRYGVQNDKALSALKNLKKSVWDCKVNQQGTSEAVILARPNWTVGSVSSWSTSAIYWDTQDVLQAADELSAIKDIVTANGGQDGIANYNYDFIDVVRQSMVDYAAQLLPLIKAAHDGGKSAEYKRLYELYLQLMLDLDAMLSYDENFKLERWTSLARNIADEVAGTTENDRNWLEWNARTQVTVWSKGNTDLHDYSNRCWAGLIKDFHYKRWEKFFTTNGGSFDNGWFNGFEYPWTVDFNDTYDLAGDYSKVEIPTDMTATEKAAQTFGNYFGRVKGATKNYIFPMGVTTDATKSGVIPEVYRGKTVELPLIIGKNVTISSVWVDLNNDGAKGNGETLTVANNEVDIPAEATIGKTTAQVVYSDGTDITFSLALVEDITAERTVTAVAGANGSVAIEGADGLTVTNKDAVKMTATANTGYNFKDWTDANGNVVSNDNPFIYYGKEAATFTANFIQDKWGVPNMTAGGLSEAVANNQYVSKIDFAYHNREAETIYDATSVAPTSLFTTIPQIIDVPQGASFTISWTDNGSQNLTKCFLSAYMDFDGDGNFEEEGELVKVVGTRNADNASVRNGSFQVVLPYDAPTGITHLRMRFDSAWGNEYNSTTKAFNSKGELNRMCYEVVINVTEKSNKAATINVETNNAEWGTVEVWTDETPDGSTGTTWNVSANIPMYLRATKTSEDVEFLGWYDHYGRLLTTELEYSMYAREDATYTAKFRKFLEIDGWNVEYRTNADGDIILTQVCESGNHDLVIPETVEILGEQCEIVGFDNGVFNNNKDLWSITMPNSMEFLSEKSLFSHTLTGNGQAQAFDVDIKNNEGWTITMDVKRTGELTGWGSCLIASGSNPAKADGQNYAEGFQFYLQCTEKGEARDKLIIKTKTQVNDNWYFDDVYQEEDFTVIIEYNGAQQLSVNVLKADGTNATNHEGKQEPIVFTDCTIQDITKLCTNVQAAITANVKIDKTAESNPFSGCSNLDRISFNGVCANYYVDEEGDLYNSSDVLVCSPEGKAKGAASRELAALIDKMKSLTAQVATYNPVGKATEIVMQSTAPAKPYYIWCSNPHDSGDDAAGGVAALLDESDDSYLHTDYTNVSATNDFLQVELGSGNGLNQFKIAGKHRKNAGSDKPKKIEILGSTDKNAWEVIATVDNITQNAGAAWESQAITATMKYPYLKFVVTTGTNRIYFHMAKFDLFKLTSSATLHKHFVGTALTADFAAEKYDALLDAVYAFDHATTADEVQKALKALQTEYTDLENKIKEVTSVKFTLDENNPVLHKIIIKRADDGSKVLQYDEPTSEKVKIVDVATDKSYQAWYFIGSEKGILIKPYNGNGKVLTVESTGDGRDKAKIASVKDGLYQYWDITKSSVSGCTDYYYIRVCGTSNAVFSNNGGMDVTHYMGMWSGGWNTDDGGSLFKIEEVTFSNNNPRYYQLKDVKATMPDGTNIYGGTSVGLYTGGQEYREAYTAATSLVTAGNASAYEDCYEAYKNLRTAKECLSYNEGDVSKYYVIKSTATDDYCKGKYVTTNCEPHVHHHSTWGDQTYDHRHLLFETPEDISQVALRIFQLETTATQGEYKLKNLHTGLYVKSFAKDSEHMDDASSAAVIKISGVADGQVKLQIGDNDPMHAQNDFSVIVQWEASKDNASTWTIDEVNVEDISHNVAISSVGYSTLFLNYPVAIPDDVTALTASEIEGDWLKMDSLDGIIPANTAVVLQGEAGAYEFKLAKEPRTVVEDIFTGTLYKQTITKASGLYYVLANIDPTPDDGVDNKEVGFYNAVNGGDETTFVNASNKAYLHIPAATTQTAFYRFRFEGDETTGIEGVNDDSEKVEGIYDLQGRKLTKITEPGIYIVNGKKYYVK